jgi:photosystem II PsbU protein
MISIKALSVILTSLFTVQAFKPMMMKATNTKEGTSLQAVSRRCAILHGAAAFLVAGSLPSFADITPLEINNPIPDDEYVPSQRVRGDKIDLNSAFVGDYKRLQGFFPHAAGMIASHGPYEKVRGGRLRTFKFYSIVISVQTILSVFPRNHVIGLHILSSFHRKFQVSDIYKIEGLTATDKKLFKKYEDEFIVKPPNKRTFNERINARVST